MGEKTSKKIFHLQLNEIHEADDPTKVECSFIILDFDVSHNNTLISKDDAMNSLAPTIINKPIVAKYVQNEEPNDGTDHFEGHNPYLDENREGETIIKMDTTPIGVFTTEGYVMEIDTPDGKKEVLAADAILWRDRFEDAVALLMEWHNEGVNINTSCEILYQNYEIKDGIEHIKSPIWMSGHAILNSEERGDYPIIKPAYDSSRLISFNELQKFNRLVAQAMNQGRKESGKVEKFQKVFELSHEDIRTKLYKVLDAQLESNQYSWIIEVFDDYFIALIETYKDDDYETKTVKLNYTKSEDDEITIDFESEKEVIEERKWVELEEVQALQSQLEEKENKLKELQSEKETLEEEKKGLEKEFNKATETITSLNEKIETLNDYKEKYEQEQFEKALKAKEEYYSEKFQALNAMDKFESEEVQDLIKKAVNDDSAVMQLNSMLVDMVVAKNNNLKGEKEFIQHHSKREDLIETPSDFDSRYK